jgi:hypothetical protein
MRFQASDAGLIVGVGLCIGATWTTVRVDDDEKWKRRVGSDAENETSTTKRASGRKSYAVNTGVHAAHPSLKTRSG